MPTLVSPPRGEADLASQYRLLCSCCAQIPLQLTAEQRDLLRDQMNYTHSQAQLAAALIRQDHVPRWYVWRGFPETHESEAKQSGTHGSPQNQCDCGDESGAKSPKDKKQQIVSIPLTEQQQATIREDAGGAAIALELSAKVLEACVKSVGQKDLLGESTKLTSKTSHTDS